MPTKWKVRDKLIKLHYKNGMTATEDLGEDFIESPSF